jgi:hypothetical protein
MRSGDCVGEGEGGGGRRAGELTRLMELPTLESVFAQLVQQTDTEQVAQEMVNVMKVRHG